MKKTFRIVSLFLSILITLSAFSCLTSFAKEYTGSCGPDAYYVYDYDSATLYIKGKGEVTNKKSYSSWVFKHVYIDEGITAVCRDAFSYHTYLEDVHFPKTLKKVGANSFNGSRSHFTDVYYESLESLLQIEYADSYNPVNFSKNVHINGVVVNELNITVPDTIENIPNYVLNGCKLLKSIRFSNSVKTIGAYAFANCTELKSVSFSDSIEIIDNGAFSRCTGLSNLLIPDSVKSIGNSSFYACSNISSVILGDGLKEIGNSAFADCGNIDYFVMGSNIEKIDSNAFSNFYPSKPITISDKLNYIGSNAFKNSNINKKLVYPSETAFVDESAFAYSNIEEVIIPDGTVSIADKVFMGCLNLKKVYIPSSLETISSYAFADCVSLENITIPVGVKTVGKYAFSKCSSIKNIIIPSSVETIENYAFNNCISAECILFAEGVKTIKECAFLSCLAVKTMSIPESVETIERNAFCYCAGLTKLLFLSKNLVNYHKYCFTFFDEDDEVNTIFYTFENSPVDKFLDTVICNKKYITDSTIAKINFDSNGGETPNASKTVLTNRVLGVLPVPLREGYSFTGWYNASTGGKLYTSEKYIYTSDELTLYAHWVKNEIKPAENSPVKVDNSRKILYGIDYGFADLDGLIKSNIGEIVSDDFANGIGTGDKVKLVYEGNTIAEYSVVIFGDINGDGWMDAFDVSIASSLINWEMEFDESSAEYIASDVNFDGVIDENDYVLLDLSSIYAYEIPQNPDK